MLTKNLRLVFGVVGCVIGFLLLGFSFIRIADAVAVSVAVFPLGCLILTGGAFCFVPEFLAIYDPHIFGTDADKR